MIDDLTYALMAGDAYIATRPDVNKFPGPKGSVSDFFSELNQ